MQNRLAIASVVLLALLGLTVWKMSARDAEVSAPRKHEVKLPELERDQIDELEISAPERESVKLRKQGDTWRLTAPLEADANQSAVSTAVDKLADLEVTGVAATNDKNYERLEVTKEKGAHVIARGGGKVLLDAYIGRYQAGNTMLRLEGETTVATVSGSIRFAFNKHLREWRNREIAAAEKDDVSEIAFASEKGNFTFKRAGDSWEQVTGPGQKPLAELDSSKVDSVVGTAVKLSATDFAADDVTAEAAGVGEKPVATVSLHLSSDAGDSEILYRIGNKAENNYYLAREGVEQIFIVSSWIGGRLMPDQEAFVKKDEPQPAPGALPTGPMGSPGNPIKVNPVQMPPGAKPPGHP